MLKFVDENRIQKLCDGDSFVPLHQKVIKLQEETGEVGQAFLKLDKAKNVSASADCEDPVELVIEECCDVINVAIDLIMALNKTGNYEYYTREIFQKKLDKWESKQAKYKA